jgi:SAM-dependent MidA family methyltransferase
MKLALEIQQEINRGGPMSFARFMELALYAPGLGYYETQREIGREGDFYTSVSVGGLFGEMLAFEFARRLESLSSSAENQTLQIVEAGAHKGELAADILRWMKRWKPGLLSRLEYWLIEPSAQRRGWQQAGEFAGLVRWAEDLSQAARGSSGIRGVIFSNELLDAMPVHRLRWNANHRRWQEWRVDVEPAPPKAKAGLTFRFRWNLAETEENLADYLPAIPKELAEVLPDGFSTEICPLAAQWWAGAASILREGTLLTLDYGLTSEEFITPERSRGTLRSYFKHHVNADVLDNVGAQDITAHVDFSLLQKTGEAQGLRTKGLVRQSKFLTRIFERTLQSGCFEPWTPARVREFQTLTHPEHLGRAFQVLEQTACPL